MISSPPDNYNSIYKYWARRGSRVLALAYKNINTKLSSIHSLTRDVVECDLIFAGFLVFNCPLKPDSINSVRELNESSHRVVMITGDNALTAAHVAKQVEIVKRDVLIGDVWEDCDDFEWRSVDEKISFKADFNSGTFDSNLKGYDLCITGRGLDKVLNTPAWAGYLLPRIWVYARVSPGQKESILTAMKEAGFQTLMCGDGTFATNLGTNDVGALKQSHVGIALLDGNEQDLEKLAERQRIKRQQQILDAQTKMREKWVGDVTGNVCFI